MNDEAGFLKSISDQPAERSTRLVFADWLDENGRPREAEFLRLQVRAAELNAKLLDLGAQLEAKWLTAVGGVRVDPQWVKLRTGRQLVMRELRQWNFYEGWLAGGPTSQWNREAVERLVAEERQRWGAEPYLIQPVERPVERKNYPHHNEPFGLLPTIACVGRLVSFQPAKDQSRHASELIVIWFQHEFAFPIDPGVREQIRAIDWDQHATDFDWCL
jgi:uncharacterized protein (TIGR02996 family)